MKALPRSLIWALFASLTVALTLSVVPGQAQTPGQIPMFDQPGTGSCNVPSNNNCVDSVISQDASGNIGIGTTNPFRLLTIGPGFDPAFTIEPADVSPNAGYIRFGDHTGWKLHFGRSREFSAGPLNTGTTGVLMTIQDNGNVGIGTQSPTAGLHVFGGALFQSFHETMLTLQQLGGFNTDFMHCFHVDRRVCHIDQFGTFVSGSDFAEALPARGPRVSYEPGDVLVMARDGGGVEKTSEPYCRRVAGVHSTRPGLLGADKNGESRVNPDDVPVAIVGIVPTKVSAENGAIEVGDLLVSASTPGHAMKGTDRGQMLGAVVGKALEPLPSGKGIVRVLVNLQ